MRSIKKSLYNRMKVQAEEASTIGMTKTAGNLNHQLDHYKDLKKVRSSDEFYVYPEEDFKEEIHKNLWNSVVRTADFYDKNFDAKEMQELVEKVAEDFVQEMRSKMGVKHGVGAYEPTIPGEIAGRVVIELTED